MHEANLVLLSSFIRHVFLDSCFVFCFILKVLSKTLAVDILSKKKSEERKPSISCESSATENKTGISC